MKSDPQDAKGRSGPSALRRLHSLSGLAGQLFGTPFALLALVVLGCVGLGLLLAPQAEENDRVRFADTIAAYRHGGLFADDLAQQRVPLPLRVIQTGRRGWGAILEEIRSAARRDLGELETLVSVPEFIAYVGKTFVSDSRLNGHVAVNEDPCDGYLNVYLLRSDPRHLSPRFQKNCAYIGTFDAVICDATWLKEELAALDRIDEVHEVFVMDFVFEEGYVARTNMTLEENKALVRAYLKANFLTWLIGHEAAHAVLHSALVRRRHPLHFDGVSSPVEYEADAFVANMVSDLAPIAVRFKVMLGEFIQQEYRRTYRRLHPEDPGAASDRALPLIGRLEVQADAYQVPLLVRALHLMTVLSDRQSEEGDGVANYGVKDGRVLIVDAYHGPTAYAPVASSVVLVRRDRGIVVGWILLGTVGCGALLLLVRPRWRR